MESLCTVETDFLIVRLSYLTQLAECQVSMMKSTKQHLNGLSLD